MKKQRFTPFFRRTLCVILSFWMILMLVLTVRNYDRMQEAVEAGVKQDAGYIRLNAQLAIEGNASWERKPAILTNRLCGYTYYKRHAMAVYRLYDENGTELARSQIARGSITPEGEDSFSVFLHFDPVFSKEEHIALAELIKQGEREGINLSSFFGHETLAYGSAYGEVTGILQENVMLPQKLEYHYPDRTITLMESGHSMFEDAELTTLRFEYGNIYTSLVDDVLSPEKLWELYWEADGLMERMVSDYTPSFSSTATVVGSNGQARVANYHELSGYPMAYAYVCTPVTMMIDGLGIIYVLTFLDALLIAWYISHTQSEFQRRERELTRAVAHEFKTPAAVIRAYAEALEADISPEKRRVYLNTLMEESDRMGEMVGELVELSRLRGSLPDMEKKEVDLCDLTRRCFERLSLPMAERGLEPELLLSPCTCVGDEKQLERAISNLALNVLYHAKPGPVTVWLSTHHVLTVENICDPVPAQIMERLWEPFYKGDSSRSGEGSGLGLAIVEHIVRIHGGMCSAENTQTGIRFRISLPGF